MSLKATVNNIAKKSKVSAQSVLQTYMLERLLERISVSKYKLYISSNSYIRKKDDVTIVISTIYTSYCRSHRGSVD